MKSFRNILFPFMIFSICVFSSRGLLAINFQFDYSYDSSGFFSSGSDARATLEAVADFYETNLADNFTAIESTPGGNSMTVVFDAPDSGTEIQIANYDVATDAIVVYVGARDLPGTTLAQAGPGGGGVPVITIAIGLIISIPEAKASMGWSMRCPALRRLILHFGEVLLRSTRAIAGTKIINRSRPMAKQIFIRYFCTKWNIYSGLALPTLGAIKL